MRKSKGMVITATTVAIVCNIFKRSSENGRRRRSNGDDQVERKEVKYEVETISGKVRSVMVQHCKVADWWGLVRG